MKTRKSHGGYGSSPRIARKHFIKPKDTNNTASQFRDKELIEKLLNQLKEAKKTIRAWHGMGMPVEQEKNIWKIYDTKSPEMKRINDVIAEAESEISALQEAKEPTERYFSDPDGKGWPDLEDDCAPD